MQNLLVTPDEVIELAFSPHDRIDPVVITETRIEAAQLKFLAPMLRGLYTALAEGLYDNFCREFIKPVAAYFVKYHIFLHLSVRIGNDGIIRLKPAESMPADASEINRLRRESRETAYLLLRKAIGHLKKNANEFPEFDPEPPRHKRPRVNGGIVI